MINCAGKCQSSTLLPTQLACNNRIYANRGVQNVPSPKNDPFSYIPSLAYDLVSLMTPFNCGNKFYHRMQTEHT